MQKILHTKKILDPINQFKYGEYIESLNEEIKFNLENFQNLKSKLFILTNFRWVC